MKKFLLIANVLLFSTLAAFPQSLSLSNADGALANNQVMWVAGDVNLPLAAFVYVTNNTAADMEVMVKKSELQLVPNTNNYFCWAQCYPSNIYVSLDPLVIAANSTNNTNFSGDYDAAGNMGISKIRYTFFKNHVPMDSVSVEVWFNAGYVGLGEKLTNGISFSRAYPNPATSSVKFSYELPANFQQSASIRISNLIGEQVSETLLSERQGVIEIPVDQMKAGVYFYSLLVNGNALVTRKLVVR